MQPIELGVPVSVRRWDGRRGCQTSSSFGIDERHADAGDKLNETAALQAHAAALERITAPAHALAATCGNANHERRNRAIYGWFPELATTSQSAPQCPSHAWPAP